VHRAKEDDLGTEDDLAKGDLATEGDDLPAAAREDDLAKGARFPLCLASFASPSALDMLVPRRPASEKTANIHSKSPTHTLTYTNIWSAEAEARVWPTPRRRQRQPTD